MVVLIRLHNEQGVALVDAVPRQAGEELAEGLIVVTQVLLVDRVAGTEAGVALLMHRREICVGDGNALLLHGRNVRQRHGRSRPVEAGEPWNFRPVRSDVGDRLAVEIKHREAGADLRRNVLVAEEAVEPKVATRFIGQHVGHPTVRRRA